VPAGTTVFALDGSLPAEALFPGDRIITRDGGARTLRAVLCHRLPEGAPLIQITRDALGGKPDQTLLLPPDQPILIRDWRARALFGARTALVPVRRLVDGQMIRAVRSTGLSLLALQFDRPHVIYAGGLELLSADPAPVAA